MGEPTPGGAVGAKGPGLGLSEWPPEVTHEGNSCGWPDRVPDRAARETKGGGVP